MLKICMKHSVLAISPDQAFIFGHIHRFRRKSFICGKLRYKMDVKIKITGIRSKYFFLIHVDDQKKGNQMNKQ